MKKAMLLALMLVTLLLTACGGKKTETTDAAATEEQITVGFIYVGPVGDGGYSYAQNEGRLFLEKETGVKTLFKESVPEGPEVKEVAKNMIDQGATVIIATSFGYMDYIEELSKEFPNVKFLHCSGYKTTENMTNYFGRIYQARYLSGLVAGLKTTSNKVGYVAAFPIPEVIRGINAFTQGVRKANPNATVEVVWTSTWYDPAKEKDAAIALIDKGADVIAQHQDTAGPQQAAEERGVFSIGYNTDMASVAPKANMTSAIWNWGPYFVSQIKAIKEGTWTNTPYWGPMSDNVVALAPLTANAPEGAQALVDEEKAKILAGSWDVFYGPVKDQTGAVKVAEGAKMTDEEMLSFNWFVEGVIGKTE